MGIYQLPDLMFGTSFFHVHVHPWSFQVKYNTHLNKWSQKDVDQASTSQPNNPHINSITDHRPLHQRPQQQSWEAMGTTMTVAQVLTQAATCVRVLSIGFPDKNCWSSVLFSPSWAMMKF
ncbi:hypothetical protein VP01_148g9 [Puccinia sorghi]|uniref:Uncharacterized protein n=1 Tax=Puccinia sorghi TaxID=27349 RepID=A0A0L6VJZ7_9BASI|nr:hypothetical protein VP01_148g9 [Puccinia sorghi]